jgi:hypothetical protein
MPKAAVIRFFADIVLLGLRIRPPRVHSIDILHYKATGFSRSASDKNRDHVLDFVFRALYIWQGMLMRYIRRSAALGERGGKTCTKAGEHSL